MAMRVLLVDDQVLFLEGLRHLLAAYDFEVVGAARNGLEALARARDLSPDVILMDVHMPCCNGLEATRAIKAEMPRVKIVMLTVSGEDEDLFEAIKAGASGYLLKSLDGEEFYELLSGLARGEAPIPRGLATRILHEYARKPAGGGAPVPAGGGEKLLLNRRQAEVLTLVALGKTYKEVSAALCLSERTVKYHMGQLLERLHLEHRAEAIAFAERMGLTTGKLPDRPRESS